MKWVFYFFLFLPQIVQAQDNNYKDVQIKLKDETTITGKVNDFYKPGSLIEKLVLFENNKDTTVFLKDILEVSTNTDLYISANVLRYLNSIKLEDLRPISKEIEQTNFILMRQIVKGDILSLYTFTDNIKTHFFIIDSSKQIITLRYTRNLTKDVNAISENKIYINQLRKYTIENETAFKILNSQTNYNERDFKHFVLSINSKNEKTLQDIQGINKSSSNNSFFCGAGFQFNFIEYQSRLPLDFYTDTKKITSTGPFASLGYYIQGKRQSSKISASLSSFFHVSKSDNTYMNDYPNPQSDTLVSNKLTTLGIGADIFFKIYSNEKIKLKVGPAFYGVNYHFSNSAYYVDEQWLNFSLISEIQIQKHNIIRINYSFPQHYQNKLSDRIQFFKLGYFYKFK